MDSTWMMRSAMEHSCPISHNSANNKVFGSGFQDNSIVFNNFGSFQSAATGHEKVVQPEQQQRRGPMADMLDTSALSHAGGGKLALSSVGNRSASPLGRFVAEFNEVAGEIEPVYEEVLTILQTRGYCQLDSYPKSQVCQFDNIRKQVADSKVIFSAYIKGLTEMLSRLSQQRSVIHEVVVIKCRKISNALGVRRTTLKLMKLVVIELCEKFQNRESLNTIERKLAENPEAEFKAFLSTPSRSIDFSIFDTLVEDIVEAIDVEAKAKHAQEHLEGSPDMEVFSVESETSAGIYQTFCLACPVREHDATGHIAQINIMPRQANGEHRLRNGLSMHKTELKMAINSIVKSGKQRHIWFRVVSEVKRRVSDSSVPSRGVQRAISRRTSMNKTTQKPSPMRVCLECIAQYEMDDPVIQMEDARKTTHHVYYLPSSERPNDNENDIDWPITLRCLLRLMKERPEYKRRCDTIKWRVHTARLIAEALLRFDRLGSKRLSCRDTVVFYQSHSGEVRPFLQVVIQKNDFLAPNNPGVSGEDCGRIRKDVLLNLAHILLELGLQEEVELKDNILPEEDLRDYCSFIKLRVDDVYANVIRNCAKVFGEGSIVEIEDVIKFRSVYYLLIVKPLQELDKTVGESNTRRR